jgi:phosphoribosylaminoimidazole carboxylase / phosphoribosylaminoimidazole-succinocarboxamide synthase
MQTHIPDGYLLAEGKTKRVWAVAGDSGLQVMLQAKDDITAGDGAKHDVMTGKAALATQTTCNVFQLLQACGIPVAFDGQLNVTVFLAPRCQMLPYEVVVRREAHGSYLKRRPDLSKGHYFPKLVVEFFLKTSGKRWQEHAIPKDDPLIVEKAADDQLFLPDRPLAGQQPFLVLADLPHRDRRTEMRLTAAKVFLVLEKAWQLLGRRLVDFKIEFGFDPRGNLLVADVIDNDSWRVLEDGQYIDKQGYRDGEGLDTVLGKYRLVAELTERFRLPQQQVVLWRGSDKDDFGPAHGALTLFESIPGLKITWVVCSGHKETQKSLLKLQGVVQEVPNTVIVDLVGRSNGLGPTLAANTTVPVISIPASAKEFPEDVWSSLRMPSENPHLTVLDPVNAVMAALQILAINNPAIYMILRQRQEERFQNVVVIE